jgi:hypothetical protein
MNKRNEPHGLDSLYEESTSTSRDEVWFIAKCLCGLPVYGRTRKQAREEMRWHIRWMDMPQIERRVEDDQAAREDDNRYQ